MSESLLQHSLDPDSPVPLYQQLKQLFVDAINQGNLKPGDTIPSEHTLQDSFHVSRSTIRRTMAELEHEGLIYRKRGRASIVSSPPIYHGTTAIAGFGDDMRSQGCKPWSRVLSVSIVCADSALAGKLQVEEGAEVLAAYRLRYADDAPVCTERPHLPVAKVGLISPRDLDGEKSLYHLLRERLNIRPANVYEVVDVVTADRETAELLGIETDDPVVRLQRTVYDDQRDCIEYAESLWRTDRFRYVAWRTGTAHIAVQECSQD